MLGWVSSCTDCSPSPLYIKCITKNVPSKCVGGKIVVDFNSIQTSKKGDIEKEKFYKMVAERAYCKAEKRGFTGGHEMEDWFEAESEIENQYFYWSQDVE